MNADDDRVGPAGPRPDDHPPAPLDDDGLLELLGAALSTADPVPAHVLAAARGAVVWRTIDQDLAECVFDSATELTGVRDHDAARQLTFRSPDLEIELMVVDAAQRRLVGQLVPGRAATVRLDSAGDAVEQQSDRYGRFSFDHVAAGPVRLGVTAIAGGRDVLTEWVLL